MGMGKAEKWGWGKTNAIKFLARSLQRTRRRRPKTMAFSWWIPRTGLGHFRITDFYESLQKYVSQQNVYFFLIFEGSLFQKKTCWDPILVISLSFGPITRKRYDAEKRLPRKSTSLACALSDSISPIDQKRIFCAVAWRLWRPSLDVDASAAAVTHLDVWPCCDLDLDPRLSDLISSSVVATT